MSLALEKVAGFPLYFDPKTLQIEAGNGLAFARTVRTAHDLREVLLSPDAVAPDTPLYSTHALTKAPPQVKRTLQRYGLTYSLVLLPAQRVGHEFVKTAGHYHPLVPGTPFAFPEMYTQLYGKLLLLLQKRHPSDPELLEDCVLIEMTPGTVIHVPPGYAHVLINTTDQPGLMAGLYGKDFAAEYAYVRAHRGLAYYMVQGDKGAVEIQPNLLYTVRPALRHISELRGTPFAPVEADVPLWRSFFQNPQAYAFLTQPEAVVRRYGASR